MIYGISSRNFDVAKLRMYVENFVRNIVKDEILELVKGSPVKKKKGRMKRLKLKFSFSVMLELRSECDKKIFVIAVILKIEKIKCEMNRFMIRIKMKKEISN